MGKQRYNRFNPEIVIFVEYVKLKYEHYCIRSQTVLSPSFSEAEDEVFWAAIRPTNQALSIITVSLVIATGTTVYN